MILKSFGRFVDIEKEFSGDKVLIYQMGKVGSSSIEASLENGIHFHSLYGNSPCFVHQNQNRNNVYKRIRHEFGDYWKRKVIFSGGRIKIISMVRDPVSRAMSMFFQDLPYWLYKHVGDNYSDTRGEGLGLLMEAFWDTYDHDYYEKWFDLELSRFVGRDLLTLDFSKSDGCQILRFDRFDIFLATAEVSSSAVFRDRLSEFIGESVDVKSSNVGENKWYSDVYKKFKSEIEFSDSWLDRYFEGKTVRHFYSEDQIEIFKDKYKK